MSNYILVNGEPVLEPDIVKWAEWYEKQDGDVRRVASDTANGAGISTVFLGIDHNFGDSGPSTLWETMVFGGALEGECVRYTSKADALAGHADMVKRVHAERRISMRIWRFFGRITRRFFRKF